MPVVRTPHAEPAPSRESVLTAQGDDRLIVVATSLVRKLEQCRVNRIDNALGYPGTARQCLVKAAEAEHLIGRTPAEGFGDSVGEQNQCFASLECRLVRRNREIFEQAENF